MKTYYIFRHGDTFATKTGEDYGDQILSAPILPESKVYLEKLAYYLKPISDVYCLSSDILRCCQTATIVGDIMQQNFVIDTRLKEFHMETLDDFINRIEEFVADMELHPHNNIVICTHGACIGALKHLLLTNEITEESLLDYPDPGVLTIITNASIKEIDFRK